MPGLLPVLTVTPLDCCSPFATRHSERRFVPRNVCVAAAIHWRRLWPVRDAEHWMPGLLPVLTETPLDCCSPFATRHSERRFVPLDVCVPAAIHWRRLWPVRDAEHWMPGFLPVLTVTPLDCCSPFATRHSERRFVPRNVCVAAAIHWRRLWPVRDAEHWMPGLLPVLTVTPLDCCSPFATRHSERRFVPLDVCVPAAIHWRRLWPVRDAEHWMPGFLPVLTVTPLDCCSPFATRHSERRFVPRNVCVAAAIHWRRLWPVRDAEHWMPGFLPVLPVTPLDCCSPFATRHSERRFVPRNVCVPAAIHWRRLWPVRDAEHWMPGLLPVLTVTPLDCCSPFATRHSERRFVPRNVCVPAAIHWRRLWPVRNAEHWMPGLLPVLTETPLDCCSPFATRHSERRFVPLDVCVPAAIHWRRLWPVRDAEHWMPGLLPVLTETPLDCCYPFASRHSE